MSDVLSPIPASPPKRRRLHVVQQAALGLIDGDEAFRRILDALPAAIYVTDASGKIMYYNDAAATLWGHRPELGTSEWCGSWQLQWPDGRPLPHDQCPMALALKESRPIRGLNAVAVRPDGTSVHFMPYPTPLFDDAGKLVGAVNMLVDLTDRNQIEQTLRTQAHRLQALYDQAERLAAIVQHSDDAIVSKDLTGIITSWNQGAERLFGYTADEMIGKSVMTLIPPGHLDEEPKILDRIRRGDHIDHYETVRRRKNGDLIDISLSVSPLKNAQGVIVGASKIARDITERKRAQEYQRIIVNESKHRIKNTLATVQAIATQTLQASSDERRDFIARLGALARAHDLLTVENWHRAQLTEIVGRALGAFDALDSKRLLVEGPEDVWLDATKSTLLTIVLHELATNAAKYGSLSNDTGKVRFSWQRVSNDQANWLSFRWSETGGPTVLQTNRKGFGSFMIDRVLRAEQGDARLEFHPQGLICTFVLPLYPSSND
jgi:two-component system, chemotaxis family, CheB/CheR fusion protein